MSVIEQLEPTISARETAVEVPEDQPVELSAGWFGAITFALMVAACAIAGWAPLGFSIVSVFLFAGPHNWAEARYFLSRMPGRWGKLMHFFLVGIGGTVLLTAAFAALPWLVAGASAETYSVALASWNTALVAWILYLVHLRSRQNPRRDWAWVYPIGLGLLALNWLSPQMWDLGLVYLHPLMALWFLDREIAERRPEWQGAYRTCVAALPALLALLWWRLASVQSLPEDDLSWTIAWHAGSGLLSGISPQLLIATHAFLEMLHYGVWLIAIPLIAWREMPWSLEQVPLAKPSSGWRWLVVGVLLCGAMAVLGLWAGFSTDYGLTRHIYFTVAMLHVLAEVPFILRLL